VTAVVVQILGEPIPQGSMRAVARGRIISDNDRLKPWRADAAGSVYEAMAGRPPLTGPVAVRATFVLPRPPSAPRRRWAPEKKPDLDKLLRALLDAATAGGAWVDDAQVIEVTARKVYATPTLLPQVQLTVETLANPTEVAA
jgi:crossover junction endodeoxyribonuclease RusA